MQTSLPDQYEEYADLFISPRDRYGVTAIVVENPVKSNDIVLSIGVPDMSEDLSQGGRIFRNQFRAPHRILRVIATEGDVVKYNGLEIKIRKDHCWLESDFDFVRFSTNQRFGAGYFLERMSDNHRATYHGYDDYNFNRRMRTSRDFGQIHQNLLKKVIGFYKTNTELVSNPTVISYEELISEFGLTIDNNRWQGNSSHKFEIDTRYKFKCRCVPEKLEYNIEDTLGTDLKGTDELSFKDSILKVTMQPTNYTVSKFNSV